MFCAAAFSAHLMAAIKEIQDFENMCNSLPEAEASKMRELRRKTIAEKREHQRKLEIAREGRSLNFWGQR
jgi:hypothetical protein